MYEQRVGEIVKFQMVAGFELGPFSLELMFLSQPHLSSNINFTWLLIVTFMLLIPKEEKNYEK